MLIVKQEACQFAVIHWKVLIFYWQITGIPIHWNLVNDDSKICNKVFE